MLTGKYLKEIAATIDDDTFIYAGGMEIVGFEKVISCIEMKNKNIETLKNMNEPLHYHTDELRIKIQPCNTWMSKDSI